MQLRTKTLRECTRCYPEIVAALASLRGRHVIDGEACVINEQGVSDWNRFHAQRGSRTKWKPGAPAVTLAAFDLLVYDGEPVMARPIEERKALLQQLLVDVPKVAVLFVQELPADANVFHALAKPHPVGLGLQIEGVVAKRRGSPYLPGVRSDNWRKVKRAGWQRGRIGWGPAGEQLATVAAGAQSVAARLGEATGGPSMPSREAR